MEELSKSLEDYLEMILMLKNELGAARVTDIANRLNVKKPAVTNALKLLSEKGYIIYEPYKEIILTDKGRKVAEFVLNRHKIISDFFVKILDLPEDIANEDACKVEHVISEKTFEKLSLFLKYILQSDIKCIDIEKFKSKNAD
ncbi:MAG: metal-dependent transcriptional regulator [Deferribacterales bacterium]